MTHKLIQTFQYGFVVLVLLGVAYFMGLNTIIAKAASLVFKTDCVTATATSTLTYMTPGTATSTVTCFMGSDGATSASLAIILNASSTATNLNTYVEESLNGTDWFPIHSNQTASTSVVFNPSIRPYAQLFFASTTVGGTATPLLGVTGEQNRNHYTLDVPVTMKYVRAYASVASTSTSGEPQGGGVWMQIIPKISI